MNVMCLNGWGGKLFDALLPYLIETKPDVLCLQEVVHTPDCDKAWLTYRDHDIELPQRARFFDDVRAALPEHVAIFCAAARGDLWDGRMRYGSQWGLATFVHRSLPIIGQHQAFVHKEFSPNGYGEHPRSRNAHAVRIFDFDNNWPVTIAHMHGLRDSGGKQDTAQRRVQAERLLGLVQSVAEGDDRMVVCGDFNVLPDSKTFDILRGAGLADLVIGRGFTGTRNSYYKKPERFADYMLVNDRLADAPFDVVRQPEVSDHCPLVLEIGR